MCPTTPTLLIPIQPPGHYPNHHHLSRCNSSGAKLLEQTTLHIKIIKQTDWTILSGIVLVQKTKKIKTKKNKKIKTKKTKNKNFFIQKIESNHPK